MNFRDSSMKRTILIRLGGLAAVVGGALYTSQAILWPSYLENVFFLFLVLGALAAIAAIAVIPVLEGERWKLPWMLVASLVAFVGAALILVHVLAVLAEQERLPGVVWLLFVGLLVGTVGLLALGILVIGFGVLPWWGGAALIVGSPILAAFLRVFLDVLVRHPLGLPGVAWAVVGYTIFRAGARLSEQPSRVR
jgi:hypothetical protein